MHLGQAQHPALCEWLRGQVKLHPLQVEAQTCADSFDEALLQGLGGKGRKPSQVSSGSITNYMQKSHEEKKGLLYV